MLQPMRPRLPRKLAASARINLNKYWQVLEELMPARRVLDEADSNAINENIDNEQRLAAMQLSDSVTGKTAERSTPETSFPAETSASSSSSASVVPMAVESSSSDENTPPSSLSGQSPSR